MGKRKQLKPDVQTTINTEIEEDHYRIKNWVAKEWSLILGSHAMHLYNIYCSAANRELGNKWFFSIRTLEEFTLMHHTTIIMNNWLLELCGLIRVDAGKDGFANEYVLLTPPHVTPEILKPIVALLKAESDVGKNWRVFKANVLVRIMKWKPMHECGKTSQYKKIQVESGQPELFTTNDNAPQITTDESNQDELVAQLVATFKDSKLTETAATNMIEKYGLAAVAQQLAWLPNRQTDTPLRTLRAALKDKWTEPKPVGKPEPEPYWKGTHLDPALNPMPVIDESPRPKPTTVVEMWDDVAAETFGAPIIGTRLMGVEGNVWVVECESFIQQQKLYKLNGALTKAASYAAEQEVELKFVIKEDVGVE